MKRWISMLLALMLLIIPVNAAGVGEINGSNDSGLLGAGSAGNYWTPGKEGIRVSVVTLDGIQVGSTVDYSNNNLGTNVYHFGKKTKINYRSGTSLATPSGGYTWKSLSGLPKVISENGLTAEMEAIRDFIRREGTLQTIASDCGVSYSVLTDGHYKIVIEPIAYFYYMGLPWAMTATEAALYDQQVCGDMYSRMGNLTHKQLPLSMFLTTADLHFPSSANSGGTMQSRAKIIERLGLIIWANEQTEVPAAVENPTVDSPTYYSYHTDKDVYTAAAIRNSGTEDITSGCTATLTITGTDGFSQTVTTSAIIPAGRYGYIWWRWHTPTTPQNLTMTVSTNKAKVAPVHTTISASVSSVEITEPPDPRPTDQRNGWTLPTTPSTNNTTTTVWHGWTFGQRQISSPTTETVYFYTESPGSQWSIWSSVVTVDSASKIPAASGAYQVEDLTETTETSTQQWGDWLGPYIYSYKPTNTTTDQYSYSRESNDWSAWETVTTTTTKSNTSTWQYELQSSSYTYSAWSAYVTSKTNPANVYASDCYSLYSKSTTTEYGAWSSWIIDNSWYSTQKTNTATKEWQQTGKKWNSTLKKYTYQYKYRTRTAQDVVTYKYKTRTRTGTQYTYKQRYLQGINYYYYHRKLETITSSTTTYKYRYRKKIWTGSGSWSTGTESIPAKVGNQYAWDWLTYTAGLQVQAQVLPDAAVKTVVNRNGKTYLKSGYGVDAKVLATTLGNNGGHITGVQTAYNLFPEFNYTTYGRLLEPDSYGSWVYPQNRYSPHMYRVHYTPLWYPDNTIYPVYTYAGDCWTPGGELTGDDIASLWIDGNLYDDWTVGLAE